MVVTLSRREFLSTLAMVALLGRAVKAEAKVDLELGYTVIPTDWIDAGHRHWCYATRVTALEDSLRELGLLLTPLVVGTDGTLLDGFHRLLAAQRQGLATIPVYVVDYKKGDPPCWVH